jgi:hypothetical protein
MLHVAYIIHVTCAGCRDEAERVFGPKERVGHSCFATPFERRTVDCVTLSHSIEKSSIVLSHSNGELSILLC